MKKLIASILIAVLCLMSFAACESAQSADLTAAKEYVYAMYKDKAEATPTDYTLIGITKVGEVSYDITWTADVTAGDKEGVKITEDDKHVVTVDVNEKTAEEIVYTLIATITAPDGSTISVNFARKVPAYALMSYAEYAATEDDKTVVVGGIISGIFSKTNGSSGNGMYIQDANAEGGYYVYGFADGKDPEADLGLKVGMTVTVTGIKDTYNGMYEVVNASVEINSSEISSITPVDYTEIYKNAADLDAAELVGKQSMLVTVKGVEISGQDTSSGYYKFKLAGKEAYARISSSNNCISKDGIEEFKALHTANFGNSADVTGIIQLYNGKFYLIPVSADAFSGITAIERTDAEKVALEKDSLSFSSSIATAGDITLPTAGSACADVVISWASDNNCAVVSGGKLTVTIPSVTTTVKLTATLKCGSVVDTKEFTVSILASSMTYEQIVDAAYGLAEGASLDGTFRLFGVITSVDTAWSEDFKNITVTIQIGDKADKLIQCFRLKGDGAKDLKVGDAITVEGTLTNFKGTIEFNSGCKFIGIGEILSDEVVVDKAYGLAAGESLEGNYTLTGVITSVDTAWSEDFKNITVTIQIGNKADKLIQCFRLKGEGAKDLKVGDTITVTGTLTNFKGTIEFNSGCTLDAVKSAPAEGGDDKPAAAAPVVGTAYKVSVVNGAGTIYFTGAIEDGRFGATTNAAEAASVFVEAGASATQFYAYFMKDNAKAYICIADNSKGAGTAASSAEATVFIFNAELGTLVVEDPDNARALGVDPTKSYLNFSTYAISNGSTYAWASFVAA